MPLVEAGELAGPIAEAAVADALAPLLGERDAAGESIFPRPPGATIDTLLLGCTHYPLLRALIAAIAGDRVAIVDSATATASALAELLSINGLEARDRRVGSRREWRGRAPGDAGCPAAVAASHLQLTTGDPAAFHALASRLFGSAFPDGRAGRPRGARPDERSTRPIGRPAGLARRPGVAGRVPDRVGAGRRRDGRRPARRAVGPQGRPDRLAGGRAHRHRPAAQRARHASTAAELRAAEPAYAEAMARIVPALSAALGSPCRGSSSGRASSTGRAGSAPTPARSRR